MDIDNLTIGYVCTMEQNNGYGNNVVRYKYSNYPNFNRKPRLPKFCKTYVYTQDKIFPLAPRQST